MDGRSLEGDSTKRRWMTLVLVALAVVVTFSGLCYAGSSAEQKQEARYRPRTFNSQLPLTVRADTASGRRKVGETPAEKPLRIPECTTWWVAPRVDAAAVDWQAVRAEVRSKNIPGLRMPLDTTDTHLAHLEGLENLR